MYQYAVMIEIFGVPSKRCESILNIAICFFIILYETSQLCLC